LTPNDYIAAMAHHVSSVCVVTTQWEGARFGLTATAVASVSADPPRLLVCLNKSGLTHEKVRAAGCFGVNVLAEAQDPVATAFAMKMGSAERFRVGVWGRLETGAPILEGAAAAFDCRIAETSSQSTHTVFFGDVVACAHRAGQDTLLYGARRYRQLRRAFAGLVGDNDYL
jgi:flavin reductase (DIM6/NTAB) family NADH-FMN oxidoreductase RutF